MVEPASVSPTTSIRTTPMALNVNQLYSPSPLDVVDNSGLRLYYTDNLRQYDSGIMVTGTTLWFPPMSIPPKADSFQVDAYCSSDCTNKVRNNYTSYGGPYPTASRDLDARRDTGNSADSFLPFLGNIRNIVLCYD